MRGYNGISSRWYQAAVKHKAGRIIAAGMTKEVSFDPVTVSINGRIDEAYRANSKSASGQAAVLTISSIATALVLIVFTVPLTTLTSTAQTFGAGAGAQAWILSAMSVGAASGLMGSGAIGDDYGRRRTHGQTRRGTEIASRVVGAASHRSSIRGHTGHRLPSEGPR